MIPILFINCSSAPYVSDILNGLKLYETRSRDMLRSLVGRRVLLAETGKAGLPVVRGSAVVCAPLRVGDPCTWDNYRPETRVPRGGKHDWNYATTRSKYLYYLKDVERLNPFTPPEGVRHGRVWMEYNGGVR